MEPSYLLDEHLRGPLWRAVVWHNRRGVYPVDVVRVGDPPDLPLGTEDPQLLLWAEQEGRVLVTIDRRTIVRHLETHLHAGRHSPGVFLIRRNTPFSRIAEFLVVAAHASDSHEWTDRVFFIP